MMVLVKLDEGEILQFSFVGISTFFEANLWFPGSIRCKLYL